MAAARARRLAPDQGAARGIAYPRHLLGRAVEGRGHDGVGGGQQMIETIAVPVEHDAPLADHVIYEMVRR